MVDQGQAIAGSPETVRAFLAAQLENSGANYVVGQFCFGDLQLEEILQSVELFADAGHAVPSAGHPTLKAHASTLLQRTHALEFVTIDDLGDAAADVANGPSAQRAQNAAGMNRRQPGKIGNLLLTHRKRKCIAVNFAALFAAQHHVNDQRRNSLLRGALAKVHETLVGGAMFCRNHSEPKSNNAGLLRILARTSAKGK